MDTTITQDLASDLIDEAGAVTPAQLEPVASEEPPVATAAVEKISI